MKKRTFLIVAILGAAVLILSGCGKKNNALLYRISGNGLNYPSYIFGTHHLAPLSIIDDVPGFNDALDSATAVVGELVMGDMLMLQKAMMPHMSIPDGKTYRDLLSEEDFAILDETLNKTMGVGLEVFENMHPAALNMVYSAALFEQVKEGPEQRFSHESVDEYVQRIGATLGKDVIGLETVEDQINAIFYSEPIEVMVESMVVMAKNPEFYLESVKTLNKYYKEHNLDKLYKASFENPDDPFKMEEFEKALVKERNDRWMKKIPGLMMQQPSFIAVGAGHLPGPDGILTQLRKAGYKVEAVK